MSDENTPITTDEVQQYFERFIRRLHQARYLSLESDEQVAEFVAAMDMFDTYYDRLLQNYYESVEFFERSASNKGTRLETDMTTKHIEAWRHLREIPLVKKRWYKRKKPLRKGR